MPHIVNSNVDENDGWFLGEDVFFQSFLQIGDLVAADSGTECFDPQIGVGCFDGFGDQGDETLRSHGGGGNRVSEEDEAIVFFQGLDGFLRGEGGGDGEEGGKCGEGSGELFHSAVTELAPEEDGCQRDLLRINNALLFLLLSEDELLLFHDL